MRFEIIGIVATLFIVLAFTRDGEKQIRVFDMIGAILFVLYGCCIHSLSTVLLNVILIGVQCYKLRKLKEEQRCTE